MTLSPAEFQLWHREYPMFMLWAIQKGILFMPKEYAETDEDKKHDLMSKVYVLMKRLGQSYSQIMSMDADERDLFFEMEMKLIQEEAKQNAKS